MFFNSRILAVLIGFFVALFSSSFLVLYGEASPVEVLITFTVSFLSAFLGTFLVLEFFVFKEIRKIYKIFNKFKSDGGIKYQKEREASVNNISQHLYTFANNKEQEIDKLKKLESFRREFLADISHELKTPIFSAQGFIHTLLDGAVDDINVRDKFLTKAAKSLDDLNNLIQDLVVISQLETGEVKLQLEYFDLYLLISEIIDQMEYKANEFNVVINLDIPEEKDYTVVGDRYRIGQVLTNLITNAIKYGRIDGKGVVEISLKDRKNSILATISDEGPGIPAEHLARIFQRFYRIDKSRSKELGGTGLGLAIVKHVLEAHSSKINVLSKEGKGTSFNFSLNKNF